MHLSHRECMQSGHYSISKQWLLQRKLHCFAQSALSSVSRYSSILCCRCGFRDRSLMKHQLCRKLLPTPARPPLGVGGRQPLQHHRSMLIEQLQKATWQLPYTTLPLQHTCLHRLWYGFCGLPGEQKTRRIDSRLRDFTHMSTVRHPRLI